jgi:ABC-type metal ion transport system substrate-binding protein
MRYAKSIIIMIIAAALAFSCAKKKKDMTVEDFLKIDMEITTSDQKPETIKAISEKYGYTFEQYKDFDTRVQNDTALQEKLGEIRLGEQKKEQGLK